MTSVSAGSTAPGLAALLEDVDAHLAAYRAAAPWPHLVLTGVFSDDVLRAAAAESRALDPASMDAAVTSRMVKREAGDVDVMGPATRRLLDVLDGEAFLGFLRRLTSIDDLSADPTHHWAGVHETPPGGFTMVHTDFDAHPDTGLWHRSNALLYLNERWEPGWGGELELWSADMSTLGRTIRPIMGTLVVFETGAHTFHGLPNPVATPDGRSRISLAAYQYSATPGGSARRRLSKYAPRPGDRWTLRIPTRWDIKERLPRTVRRLAGGARRALTSR